MPRAEVRREQKYAERPLFRVFLYAERVTGDWSVYNSPTVLHSNSALKMQFESKSFRGYWCSAKIVAYFLDFV